MGKLPILTVALAIGVLTQLDAQPYNVIYVLNHPGDPVYLGPTNTISQSPGGYLLCTSGLPNGGLAFEMSTGGGLKILHAFTGPEGKEAEGGLVLGTDQRFHGTAASGGKHNFGTVFRLAPDGQVTVEHSFTGGTDGEFPESSPIQSVGGHFYGVTLGSVYRISASHEFSVLHTFSGPDGTHPYGQLVQGTDGRFYGMAHDSGAHELGTIFRISADGVFKVLYNFDGTHGGNPDGSLIQATDGNFYGLTSGGGTTDSGVVFKMTPAGSLTVLHTFSGNEAGASPYAGLVEASDGNFYGTTSGGGAHGQGILFRLASTGEFTTLHDFEESTGADPFAPLIQHTNGKLYGFTGTLGTATTAADAGVLFEYDLALPPFVTYLPVYGLVGAKVMILGQYFENNSVVSFNGVPSQNVEIHPTYIKAIVPDGATTGPITVATSKGGQSILEKSKKIFVVH